MSYVKILQGDCREQLRNIADASIDSIVTDPPYELGFMNRKWDSSGIAYDITVWRECLRVLKPGGHLLSFGGTRTYHRMTCAIEDAGFEIRDCIMWVYGCLSEDTEVLTERGWMHYHRAKQERVLAYDIQNDIYQWEKPSRWNEYRVKSDTAYRIQSDYTDQIVSRGHRCVVERGGKLTFIQADELSSLENMPTLQNDFFDISQRSTKVLQQTMQRILQRQGLGKGRLQGSSRLDRNESCYIQNQNDRRQKPSMEGRLDVLQAQREIRQSINQICTLSNGNAKHGSKGWLCNGTQTSCGKSDRKTANSNGMCSSCKSRCNRQQNRKFNVVCNQRGSQEIRTRPSYQTTMATVSAIKYSGLIWCPTVSTGAFVARRNGKIFITGNSGFPKSHDVSKAIDKAAGAERKVVGYAPQFPDGTRGATYRGQSNATSNRLSFTSHDISTSGLRPIEEPATEAAKQWQGWGSALKPAVEPIVVARKPLDGTIADNVLRHGTGGFNIDGCRVGAEAITQHGRSGDTFGFTSAEPAGRSWIGRWPANLIHDGSDEVVGLFPQTAPSKATNRGRGYGDGIFANDCNYLGTIRGHSDSGSAARFFYCAKTSPSERGDNNHPTVKPLALMRYLCRLVTPPQGVVLDPFAGSGSTLVAARAEGFSAIGCELEAAHIDIIKRRLDLPIEIAEEQPREEKQQDSKKKSTQLKLF